MTASRSIAAVDWTIPTSILLDVRILGGSFNGYGRHAVELEITSFHEP